MTSVDISQADYAKQLIQHLEQDKTFNIELKEASNVFLEKSVETYYDFYEKGKRGSQTLKALMQNNPDNTSRAILKFCVFFINIIVYLY